MVKANGRFINVRSGVALRKKYILYFSMCTILCNVANCFGPLFVWGIVFISYSCVSLKIISGSAWGNPIWCQGNESALSAVVFLCSPLPCYLSNIFPLFCFVFGHTCFFFLLRDPDLLVPCCSENHMVQKIKPRSSVCMHLGPLK